MPERKALLQRLSQSIHRHGRGLLVCLVVALAVQFISEHYGGPALLYALMLGLALNFLGGDERLRPGIDLCSRSVLRLGVALLGARISVSQVQSLGWPVAAFTVIAVILTVGFGVVLARCLRRHRDEGLISGCAVGICGASAALAAASVLPQTRENERFTMMALISVTLLSSMAMLGYPLIATWCPPRQVSSSERPFTMLRRWWLPACCFPRPETPLRPTTPPSSSLCVS